MMGYETIQASISILKGDNFNKNNPEINLGIPFTDICFYSLISGEHLQTAYECEGQRMSISCHDDESGEPSTIRVVRANYGRFSIAICNRHGFTD